MSPMWPWRFISSHLGLPEARRAEFEEKKIGGYKALDVMEKQLSRTPFLVGEQFSIADITSTPTPMSPMKAAST